MNNQLEEPAVKKNCRTVVITFLDLPQGNPPIQGIISLAGAASKDLSLKVSQGRVEVGGTITLTTMYREENNLPEEKVQMMNHTIEFDYLLRVPAVRIQSTPQVYVEIEYLNYELVDSSTIELEIIFLITALVWR